jgi:predicted transcriptional regulator
MTEHKTSTHQVTLYDQATGEATDLRGEIELPKRKSRLRRGKLRTYGMIDLSRLALLRLTGAEGQVFMQLVSSINRETGQSRMQIREIAAELHSPASSISRTMSNLQKRNLVFKEGTSIYRVSPYLTFRGDGTDWDTAEMLYAEPTLW